MEENLEEAPKWQELRRALADIVEERAQLCAKIAGKHVPGKGYVVALTKHSTNILPRTVSACACYCLTCSPLISKLVVEVSQLVPLMSRDECLKES